MHEKNRKSVTVLSSLRTVPIHSVQYSALAKLPNESKTYTDSEGKPKMRKQEVISLVKN